MARVLNHMQPLNAGCFTKFIAGNAGAPKISHMSETRGLNELVARFCGTFCVFVAMRALSGANPKCISASWSLPRRMNLNHARDVRSATYVWQCWARTLYNFQLAIWAYFGFPQLFFG